MRSQPNCFELIFVILKVDLRLFVMKVEFGVGMVGGGGGWWLRLILVLSLSLKLNN